MNNRSPVGLIAFALLVIAVPSRAQSGDWGLIAKVSRTIPTSNMTQLAGGGIGAGAAVGKWAGDHVLLQLSAAYHDFGDGTSDDGSTTNGALIPVELGWHYYPKTDARGLFLSFFAGATVSQGDFVKTHGDLSVGFGWAFPLGTSGTRLLTEIEYRSVTGELRDIPFPAVGEPGGFNSYLLVNLGIMFRL